jgi:hypothetical protein
MNEAIDMKEAKEKLMDIFVIDDEDNLIKQFGRFLSPRLNDKLDPAGFVLGCMFALYDLSEGNDGHTQEPIQNPLVGYPNMVYIMIEMRLDEIAKVIFPSEFADEVAAIIKER